MSARFLIRLDDLPAEGVVTVDAPDGGLIVARTADGAAAYLDICPHLGASLRTADGKVMRKRDHLFCAHHAAIFDANTGACVWGPCQGKGLTPVAIEIKEDAVWLA